LAPLDLHTNTPYSGGGEDAIYGGDGNDLVDGSYDGLGQDRLYCGKGKDKYIADRNDYVVSSCEVKR